MSRKKLTCNSFCITVYIMNEEKSKTIQIRVTPEEKAGIIEAAEISGISLSSWVRERLRIAAIRDLEGAGRRVPFIKPLQISLEDNDAR